MRQYMQSVTTRLAGWFAVIALADVVMVIGLVSLYVGLSDVGVWLARVVVGAILVRLAWPFGASRPMSSSGVSRRAVR